MTSSSTSTTMATAALQRPYRGSRVSSFYPVKSLPPLSALDSAFQLQEYISLLIRLDVHDVDTIVALPGRAVTKDADEKSLDSSENDAKKPEDGERKSDISVDRACWIYEQLRRLAQDLSHPLITMLQQECTRSSCPQMKAGEWLYLCVAHGNDGAMEQCCAIDYILHTVDSATALLNSPRAFPSRLSIPQTSHRHFPSLARRLGRIFAHAYFHHREAFEQAEAESSLYARFLKLTNQFDLVPAEFLVIPESAVLHDGRGPEEEVEPPRLSSAAVHPTQNYQNTELTADEAPKVDLSNSRPSPIDSPSHIGTDSPRRVGRSRTDTMVFSEAYNAAEELSKPEHSGSLLSTSPIAEPQSLVSEQSWPDTQTRTEELEDDDDSDTRSEVTIAGPLSPPVEELPLISLEETSSAAPPDDTTIADTISEPAPPPQVQPSDDTVVEPASEQLPQTEDTLEENAPVEEPSTSDAAEVAAEEGNPAAETVLESTSAPPQPEEAIEEPSPDEGGPTLSSAFEDSDDAEPRAEPEPPAHTEYLLDLSEPPPSEPIPPESESDITDEATGLDGDEVTQGGEEVVGE